MGNELYWYNRCQADPNLSPFLEVMPELVNQFRMRLGVDKIDLVMDGISEDEMTAL